MDWNSLATRGLTQTLLQHVNERSDFHFRDFHRRTVQPSLVVTAVAGMDGMASSSSVARRYLRGIRDDYLREAKTRSAIRTYSAAMRETNKRPWPVRPTKLVAFYFNYVFRRGNKSGSLRTATYRLFSGARALGKKIDPRLTDSESVDHWSKLLTRFCKDFPSAREGVTPLTLEKWAPGDTGVSTSVSC
jgi:hypothetical protein